MNNEDKPNDSGALNPDSQIKPDVINPEATTEPSNIQNQSSNTEQISQENFANQSAPQPVQDSLQPQSPAQTQPEAQKQHNIQDLQGSNMAKKGSGKPKILVVLVFVGLLLFGGAAAAYVAFFNKSPEQLWESALNNTAAGLEEFINMNENSLSGTEFNGSFSVTSPLAVDGSVDGKWNNNQGEVKADVGAAGIRVNTEIKVVGVENSDVPDVYIKADGLNSISSLLGAGGADPAISEIISSIDGQWYVVDHTLIAQALANEENQENPVDISEEELKEISTKITNELRNSLFSTDPNQAVFQIEETVGEEEFEGTKTYKFVVSVNKENLKKMINSLVNTIKDTKLEEVLISGSDKTLEEAMDIEGLTKAIDEANFADNTADVWVEENGLYIRNIRLYPVSDDREKNYLDFSMPYEGGDVFPFVIKAVGDDEDFKGELSFGVDLNKTNADIRLWFDMNMDGDSQDQNVQAKGELSIKGSEEEVSVEAPVGAKNIYELLGVFLGPEAGSVNGANGLPNLNDAVETLGAFDIRNL